LVAYLRRRRRWGDGGQSAQGLKHGYDDDCNGEGNQAHNILTKDFDTVYGASGGVHVGLPCSSNRFSMTFTSPAAIENYLPADGSSGVGASPAFNVAPASIVFGTSLARRVE